MKGESTPRICHVLERVERYASRGNYRGAEGLLLAELRSAQIRPADRLILWNELGMICKYLGKFRKSRQWYRSALLRAGDYLQGAERDFFLADLYHNLGGLEHARGRFLKGEKFAREGLQLRRRVSSEQSLPIAVDMAALAALLDGQKKFAEAELLYRRALRIYRREYGSTQDEVAILIGNLAALCQATGRFSSARDYYQQALEVKRQKLGANHPSVAITLNNLGMLDQTEGDSQAAKRHMGEARTILYRSVGRRHFQYRAVESNYQRILRGIRAG